MKPGSGKRSSVSVGDRVHVEGCHRNYTPALVAIEGGVGIVQTRGLGEDTRRPFPIEKLWKAEEWKHANKGKRRR